MSGKKKKEIMDVRSDRETKREISSDFIDSPKGLLQRQNKGITFSNAGFIQDYLQKELCILVHFHVRNIDQELVALFQRKGDAGNPSPSIANPLIAEKRSTSDGGDVSPSGDEHVVLVDSVQAMESPEGVIPSLVRVSCADRIYGFLPHALYLSAKSGFVTRGNRSVIEDREFGVARRGLVIPADEATGKIVQGSSEVLDDIPGNEGNLWRNPACFHDVDKWLTGLRISIYLQAVGVSFNERRDGDFELLDTLVGPLDL